MNELVKDLALDAQRNARLHDAMLEPWTQKSCTKYYFSAIFEPHALYFNPILALTYRTMLIGLDRL